MTVLTLDTRFTLDMPLGTISESGMILIMRHINAQRANEGIWKDKNPDSKFTYLNSLPEDWAWIWIVTGKGDYVGTFPKRVSKFYHKEQQLKCPPEFLTELGNIARAHSSDAITYHFEFVNHANWNAGDYGDHGSCWWGSYSDGKDTFFDNGGMAIRFYDPLGNGVGRAWVVAHRDVFILFNGYGLVGDPTLIMARVMATHLGLSYKKIDLSNHGESGETIYINGGSGYVIGHTDDIAKIDEHDFEFGDEKCSRCESCGDRISEGDEYYAMDNTYCESCYYDNFSSCDRCGDAFYDDDVTYIEGHGSYCDSCRDRRFTFCDGCEDYHPNDDITHVDDATYCEKCLLERYETCDGCDELKPIGTLIEMNDDSKRLCNDCRVSGEDETIAQGE
jgi:hypothetical protein